MKKYLCELIGTFVLVFGGCGTAIFAGGNVGFLGVALAFGLTIVAMAYGIGGISGAHLNPAVSFGIYINGKMSGKDFGGYVIAQVLGGLLASAILFFIAKSANMGIGTFAANGFDEFFSDADVLGGYKQISMFGAFIVEALLTFIFLMVILGVTDEKNKAVNSFAGLAIGLTLTLIHLISIPLTNTSVNPARSIGQAIFSENTLALPQLWLFIAAPLFGAGLAGLLYKYLKK
ncbi:MAG: aquaporin [Bacteroidia bacterium]|nr:aquaporin [Bacteroidia bacterium]